MHSIVILLAGLISAPIISAQTAVPVYGQCGGIGYAGSTICASGSTCVYTNDYWSQCLPGTITSKSTTTTKPITTSTSTTKPCGGTVCPVTSTSTTSTSTTIPVVTSTFTVTRTITITPTCSNKLCISTSYSSSTRTTSTRTTSTSTTCTSYIPHPTIPVPTIISPLDGIKVTKYELTLLSSNKAALAPKGTGFEFEYSSDQSVGGALTILSSNFCNPRRWYLTIDESSKLSYKPLYWADGPKTEYWIVAPGKEITTGPRSPYGAVATFLACGDEWELFLQTGSDIPPDVYCEKTTLLLTA